MSQQLTVILPEELNEQLKAQVHTTIMKAIEEARHDVGLDKQFLKKGAAIKWCGVSHTTFTTWVERGMPSILLDGVQLYSKDQMSEWLKAQAI